MEGSRNRLLGKWLCRHSVQVGHSAKTWATVRGTKQSIQYGGCDASIRYLCVSLVCPILSRHKMISVRRDRLLDETQGVGASLIVRNLFLMGTSDHSKLHLLRTALLIAGKKSLYGRGRCSAGSGATAAPRAASSACSLPTTPQWPGTQHKRTFLFLVDKRTSQRKIAETIGWQLLKVSSVWSALSESVKIEILTFGRVSASERASAMAVSSAVKTDDDGGSLLATIRPGSTAAQPTASSSFDPSVKICKLSAW